jgi:hypothetical protein
MARFLKDPEELLHYLARENIVPVKAPEWADHPFELRRNEKSKRDPGGRLAGKETTALVLEILGVHDEKSCKATREQIKHLRRSMRYP